MSVQSLLTQRCTISRWASRGKTRYVVQESTEYSDLATDVACLVQDKSPQMVELPFGQNVTINAEGFFLPGQDIQPSAADTDDEGDVITITSPTNLANRKYKVVSVTDDSGKDVVIRALLKSVA